ncbi:protease inhibitor I42 family protein [Streptomyces sp. VRA16 Mangrove soil]|uniref:protease inhibitor I42 family protein n=1 Tax=Streptomyces sp. VRA16 Mangrove soil TaxID=2817434 RepID=UPI001A9CF7C5|nr:protease inhibitor I42 family protein [Streptomyces sp. VRA16 Mangrove soil]MBO1332125.1 protease inhibitor I42 family protein [Streptomyces sp. VRA16 Mangrove soil]
MRTASIFRSSSRGGGAAVAAVAVLALATGCGSGANEPSDTPAATARHSSGTGDGTTSRPVKDTRITAAPGERFTLTVGQNASTRDYWYLVDPRPDSAVLVSRGQKYAAAKDSAPGSSGRLTFTFEAKGKGTTRFTLLHCTFTTCQGNTADRPPGTTSPSATPSTPTATPTLAPRRITYTVTVD